MGKYTQAINLQRRAVRLRKEAAGLDKKAGIADWLANNWGRLAAGGAAGLGVYGLSGLFDPKKKNRGVRAALSALAAGLVGTKGYDWAAERWDNARTAAEQARLKSYVRPWQNEDDTGPATEHLMSDDANPLTVDPTGFDAKQEQRQARLNNALRLVQLRQQLADKKAEIQKRKTGVDPLASGNRFGDMTPAQIAQRNAAPREINIGPKITKEDVKSTLTSPIDIAKNLWNAGVGNIKAAVRGREGSARQKEADEIKALESQIKALEGK